FGTHVQIQKQDHPDDGGADAVPVDLVTVAVGADPQTYDNAASRTRYYRVRALNQDTDEYGPWTPLRRANQVPAVIWGTFPVGVEAGTELRLPFAISDEEDGTWNPANVSAELDPGNIAPDTVTIDPDGTGEAVWNAAP